MNALLRRPEQLRELLGVPFSEPQLEAAAAPLQPGVIVAGAGSGKTTVMAARVVWLVGSGAVRPDQVLGLTFTNKAAAELAARVRAALERARLLSADVDGLPQISTYHAYAGTLVQEHGLRLGVEPRASLLADATRFQLAERVIRRAPGPFLALQKQVSSLVGDLLALDGELSEHLVGTEALREHDQALIAEVEALAKPTKKVLEVAETARRRIELTGLVDDYRAEKAERARLDFGDQLALAARLAETRPEVGVGERERFGVVLLDEYQDTSVAQRRMLSGLFGAGHPVTAVGDPCQAIYGWRGASVANLDEFPRHFALADGTPARRVSLAENRRSGSRLLELANTVARALHVRHAVEPLTACAERQDAGDTVCALLPTYSDEMAWSADQVVAALAEGVPAGEIAVLVRVRSDFAAVFAALAEREVPVEVVGLGGLLALPEVADVVSTLEVVSDPTANAALVRLLSGPRWRIGPRDLALLGARARALASPGGSSPGGSSAGGSSAGGSSAGGSSPGGSSPTASALDEAVAGVDPADVVALLDAVEDLGRTAVSPEARVRLAGFAHEIADLRRGVGDPLLDVLSRVVSTLGLDVELAASPAAVAAGRQESLAAFLDIAARFVDLDGAASVGAFLGFLRAADDYDRGLDNTAPSSGDTVKLMTAHKSKGLEWDVVVLPNLTKDVFPSSRGRSRWPTVPSVLPSPLRGDAETLPTLEGLSNPHLDDYVSREKAASALEEQRLGYVALTRARHRLIASAHWWGPTQKRSRGPSPYLVQIRTHAEAGNGAVLAWAERPAEGETNPLRQRPAGTWVWPPPLEPEALARRRGAAAAVRRALEVPTLPFEVGGALGPADDGVDAVVAGWARDAALLLEELRAARALQRDIPLPATLTTSQLLRLAAEPEALARDLVRPMPRPPAGAARRGTAFHAWVEARFAQQPLLDPDELPGAADDGVDDDAELEALQQAFLRSPYADREPYAVEAPFEILLAGRVVRGRIDAVYETPDGFEVVDWKTGRGSGDPLQLAVYRLAWAQLHGLEPDQVQACFVHLATGRVVRPDPLPGPVELAALLGGPGSAGGEVDHEGGVVADRHRAGGDTDDGPGPLARHQPVAEGGVEADPGAA